MSERINFIRESVADIQSTIAFIDKKIAALLAVLLLPLAKIGQVSWHVENFLQKFPDYFGWLVVLIFLLAWALAIISAVRVVSAIENPARHIVNHEDFTGIYYSGGMYELGLVDVFRNRDVIKACRDVGSHLGRMPDNLESVEKELVFEQLKLVYIRDMKLCRLGFSIKSMFVWVPVGVFIYVYSRFL